METKICKVCNMEKQLMEFNRNRNMCKLCQSKYFKEWRLKNKKYLNEYARQYKREHKEMYSISSKKHYKNNKDKINKRNLEYTKRRRNNDKIFKLKDNIRKLTRNAFGRKDETKTKMTEEILGCDLKFFTEYLLQTFKKNYGYEWDGKEKVHIDHIRPLAIANKKEEIVELCNYRNLQLLKAEDNLQKGCKLL